MMSNDKTITLTPREFTAFGVLSWFVVIVIVGFGPYFVHLWWPAIQMPIARGVCFIVAALTGWPYVNILRRVHHAKSSLGFSRYAMIMIVAAILAMSLEGLLIRSH
jgi:hypothetical protein